MSIWPKRLTRSRVFGAERIMRARALTARTVARAEDDPNSQFAAAMRGKARGYEEAADLLRRLREDRALPPKKSDMRGDRS